MKSARRRGWLGLSVLMMGVLALAVALPGCPPVAEPPSEPPAVEPPEPVEPIAEPAEPAEPVEEPAELPEPAEPAKELAQPAEEPAEPAEEPAEPAEEPAEPAEEPAEPAEPAEEPAEPAGELKVSDFAPAEDLASQVPEFIEDLEEAVESEEEYNDSKDKIGKGANTLILIALGLGLNDQDSEYKARAGALMKAAKELTAADDFAAAKAGVDAVKTAAAGQAEAATELKWEKVASLPELMKQVPLVNTKLKRYIRGDRFKSKADDTQGFSAVIAVIAHGSMQSAGDTEKPDEVEQWQKFCTQMREAAAAVNAGIRAQDEEATTAAMARLQQSCDDCHAVFHEEELDETE